MPGLELAVISLGAVVVKSACQLWLSDRQPETEAALEMLLVRRDRDRGVELAETPLTRTEKTLLLQDIAFWLVRNGWSPRWNIYRWGFSPRRRAISARSPACPG
jgi:hypothetical protein